MVVKRSKQERSKDWAGGKDLHRKREKRQKVHIRGTPRTKFQERQKANPKTL